MEEKQREKGKGEAGILFLFLENPLGTYEKRFGQRRKIAGLSIYITACDSHGI